MSYQLSQCITKWFFSVDVDLMQSALLWKIVISATSQM